MIAEQLAEAEAGWKRAEAERVAAAEARWRAEADAKISAAGQAELDATIAERLAEAQARWQATEAERLADAEARWRVEADAKMGESDILRTTTGQRRVPRASDGKIYKVLQLQQPSQSGR